MFVALLENSKVFSGFGLVRSDRNLHLTKTVSDDFLREGLSLATCHHVGAQMCSAWAEV
jgi:hypothetical protein